MRNPKRAIVGDHWDEETRIQIVDLLKEYGDIFPSTFFFFINEGIVGELGEMKYS